MKIEKFIPIESEELIDLTELEKLSITTFDDVEKAKQEWLDTPPMAKYQNILNATIETNLTLPT